MAKNPKLREGAAELRWLAARLEMLGHPGPRAEDHVAALTRAMMARAIRVIANVIEEIDRMELGSVERAYADGYAAAQRKIERLRAALAQARTDLRYLPCRPGTSKARSIDEAVSRIDVALDEEGK